MSAAGATEGERIARLAADAFNRQDADAFAALAHPDFAFRPILTRGEGDPTYRGIEGARQYLRDVNAWATTKLVVHEVGAFGDVMVTRAELDIAANGRRTRVPAVYITRLRDGLVAELATLADVASAAEALAVPEPEDAGGSVSLTVEAAPEHLPALRSAARAFATLHEVDPVPVALAVSEAATNAILHAYLDAPAPGTVELRGRRTDDGIVVSIADQGSGLRPRPDSPGLGMGLSMMQRLADEVSFIGAPQRAAGTEVRLRFRAADAA